MPKSKAKPFVSTPLPTDPAADSWLRKQYDWDNIQHLIKDGRIVSLFYDFEATDLNPMFAAPTQFCGKIVDVQGRVIDRVKIDIQVPEDVAISPQAAIVTQSDPASLYDAKGRVPPHIAAGQILLFFRNPYRKLWDMLEDHVITLKQGEREEEVREYTVASPDGSKHATLRIHQGGRFLSCRYPDRVDAFCDALEMIDNKPVMAAAIAKVLGVRTNTLYDSQERSFNRTKVEQGIRAYDGKIDAFQKAIHQKMGDLYPPELRTLLTEDRLPDGATTYRDPDGKRWKKFASPAITTGHNIRRYDDRLLWSFLHSNMSDEIFLTHTKKFRRFRVDTLDLAKLVALLDDGGENGFKPGIKINKDTGQPYEAFTLSSLMEANTRDAAPERGVDEGVRMPDGSKYDRRYAHANAEYDVDATIALKAYLRKREPELARLMEINADFDRIKPFLIGGEGFEMRPLRAFARNVFPHQARLHFGVCVNINEEIEERRQAVMIRTDTDQPLENYTFRHKKLLEMSVDELAVMLKEQSGKPEALCEIINLRKNPPIVPAQMAFERGKGKHPDQYEANRRFVLAHEELCQKLMLAHSKTMPIMPDYRTIRNPQAEEHLFTGIASPKRYECEIDGKKELLTETAHAEWVKALRHNRSIDASLRRAIKPQTVEFEVRADTLEAFIERMESVDQHLQKYLGVTDALLPEGRSSKEADKDHGKKSKKAGKSSTVSCGFKMLPPPDHSFFPPKDRPMTTEECKELTANAIEYLWKLRAEFMHDFHDNTTSFTVQDRHGHDIAFPELNRMKQGDLADRLRTGEYDIHKEELNWSAELVARMFRNAGRIEWVKHYWAERGREDMVQEWNTWEEYFSDLRALRFHGAPHEDTDQKRWMTAAKVIKEVARIRDNMRSGDIRALDDQWGQWDIFMPHGDAAEPILKACETHAHSQLNENPLTEERQRRLGYDPSNRGFPIEHARYELPAGAKTITIDVPDGMLEKPLKHHHVASKILMLDPTAEEREALAKADAGTFLCLRGAQSGRTFLAAKPKLLSADEISPTPYFHLVYADAANRYHDSGVTPPAEHRFMPLAVEALSPVPCKVDLRAQTIKVPRWEDFMATVSPTLGYRDTLLTGLVIKDHGLKPTPGAARLQGMTMEGTKPGLTESGWEVPATITQVRTLTLKEAQERIKNGREQMKAVAALQMDSVESLRTALTEKRLSKEHLTAAGISSHQSLYTLMGKESFTPKDALHYGYASLSDMQSKLTALFLDHERAPDREDNLIHFVDIAPVNKAQMAYHPPGKRLQVRLAEPLDRTSPAPEAPDPSRVYGAPDIERGRKNAGKGAA